jgi:uncharacterized RDD family membrane protein YckC
MTCPSCGASIPAGERCSVCSAATPLPEGALAPDAMDVTPPPRGKVEPLREIPALKKKERTWKDEVRERVRHRKRSRKGEEADLPLFEGQGQATDAAEPIPAAPAAVGEPLRTETHPDVTAVRDEDDLPLQAPERIAPEGRDAPASPPDDRVVDVAPRRAREPFFDEAESSGPQEWTLDSGPPAVEPRPVERPAHLGERIRAAAIDLTLLAGLWALVVYFASRAARVGVVGMLPAWPYLASYLAFLGLVYAGYFSGTTGQTLGKIATGLRVVDKAGQPPGYLRSFARAAVGSLGISLVFAGVVPVFFDPARRALHDRIFKTRVIKG